MSFQLNVGDEQPVQLLRYIELSGAVLGTQGADGDAAAAGGGCAGYRGGCVETDRGGRPKVLVEERVASFVRWYLKHYVK